MDSTLLVVVLGAVTAGFVQGLSGFAFGMVAMSFWVWVLDPKVAAGLSIMGALTGQIVAAITVRRGFQWRLLLPFLLGGLCGIPLGVMVLSLLDPVLFRACVGLLLVVICPLMLLAGRLPRMTAGGRVADAAVGVIGGIMGAVGGFAGTVPALWCTLRGWEKSVQRAVLQNFNLAVLAVAAAVYLGGGMLPKESISLLAIVLPAMLIPSLLGARVYIGISEQAFRRIVLGLLILSGVVLLPRRCPNCCRADSVWKWCVARQQLHKPSAFPKCRAAAFHAQCRSCR